MATLRAECSFEWEPVSKEPRAQRPGLSQFWGQPVSVVELSDTAQAREVRRLNPASTLEAGISYQSGDRAVESVFLPLPVMDNVTTQLGPDAGPAGLALGGRLRTAFAAASRMTRASQMLCVSGFSQ